MDQRGTTGGDRRGDRRGEGGKRISNCSFTFDIINKYVYMNKRINTMESRDK